MNYKLKSSITGCVITFVESDLTGFMAMINHGLIDHPKIMWKNKSKEYARKVYTKYRYDGWVVLDG